MIRSLSIEERCFFRDQLREARAGALLDAEGSQPIVVALERLGAALHPKGKGLGDYRRPLLEVAGKAKTVQAFADGRSHSERLNALFSSVKNGRNEAVHEGAYARHLVGHCVELALLVEEGLMVESKRVGDFMVRDPVCAEAWQQVALARQQMLVNSYSYLPIFFREEWKLLSDYAVASYLVPRAESDGALRERIGTAADADALVLEPAIVVGPSTLIQEAIQECGGKPVLVIEEGRLVGIATPFDFL